MKTIVRLFLIVFFLPLSTWAQNPKIEKFVLINSNTNQAVRDLTLPNDAIDLTTLGHDINIQAVPEASTQNDIAHVQFRINSTLQEPFEFKAPYALAGDNSGNYNSWFPAPGNYKIQATPYKSGSVAGTHLEITLTITTGGSTPGGSDDWVINDENGDTHSTLFLLPNIFQENGGFAEIKMGDPFHSIRTKHSEGMILSDFNQFFFKTIPNETVNPTRDDFVTRMMIGNNGYVGMGTSNPQHELHVKSSDKAATLFIEPVIWQEENPNPSSYSEIRFGDEHHTIRGVFGTGMFFKDFNQITFSTVDDPFDKNMDNVFVYKDRMVINDLGVGIGVDGDEIDAALTVNGLIHSKEVLVDLDFPGPDYVFEDDYPLPSIPEIEAYIQQHKHLPGVPSAKEMEASGIQISVMQMKLLEKVEELTLYVIEQEKRLKKLEVENERLRTQIESK